MYSILEPANENIVCQSSPTATTLAAFLSDTCLAKMYLSSDIS